MERRFSLSDLIFDKMKEDQLKERLSIISISSNSSLEEIEECNRDSISDDSIKSETKRPPNTVRHKMIEDVDVNPIQIKTPKKYIIPTKKPSNILYSCPSRTTSLMKKLLFKAITEVETQHIKNKNESVLEQLIKELRYGAKFLQIDDRILSNKFSVQKCRNSNIIMSKRRKAILLESFKELEKMKDNLINFNSSPNKYNKKRDGFKIMNLLKLIPDFHKYMELNSISEEALIKASDYLIYMYVKPNVYLLNEGDNPDGFYCILSGNIDITKKSENIKKIDEKMREEEMNNNLQPEFIIPKKKGPVVKCFKNFFTHSTIQRFLNLEEKIVSLGPGNCFGDWGLIDNKKRLANAISTTECHIVKISKIVFDMYFKVRLIILYYSIRNAF